MSLTRLPFGRKLSSIAIGGAISVMAASAGAVEGPYLPPDGKKLLIVGQDTLSISNYVNGTSVQPGGVTGYINIGDLSGLTTNVDNGAGPNNMGELFQNYPESTLAIGAYLVNQLDDINNGSLDENLDELIRILASWERPVWLRWGYEFDGEWNGYDPAAFRSAWIRMYDKVQAAGANNIIMVWQGATYCGGTFGGNPIQAWYPGDEYVDWMGMSYFTPQDCNNGAIQPMVDFARSKNKPLMIAESAPQRYDIDGLTYNPQVQRQAPDQNKSAEQIWNEWFVTYFNFIESNSDVIKTVAYINADWDSQEKWASPYPEGYWGDTRVEANSTILNNWLAEIQGDDWLNASPDLFTVLGGSTPSPSPTPGASPSPTPSPSPAPIGSTTVEAETASLSGEAQIFGDSAASGGQGVAYLYNGGSAMSLAAPGDSVGVVIRYASEFSGQISMRVGGADAGNVSFSSTGAWTGNYSEVSADLSIGNGESFDIFWDNGDTALNVDTVEFVHGGTSPSPSPSPIPSPSPSPVASPSPSPIPSPSPSPVPSPSPSPVPTPSPAPVGAEFGIEADGTLYHLDGGQTAGFVYLCLDGDCRTPDLVNGRYERELGNIGSGPHNIEFKVQDNATGQCIASGSVNLGGTIDSQCVEGTPAPSPSPVPSPSPSPEPSPSPSPVPSPSPSPVPSPSPSPVPSPSPSPVPSPSPSPVPSPSPSPVPSPSPSPVPSPTPAPTGGDFCLTTDGRVTHTDLPFRANYSYLCLDGQCLNASLNNGVWERQFENVVAGNTYTIKTQIDHSTGECGIQHQVQPGQCVASTCLPPDEEAPTVPTNLTGEGKNGQAAKLNWTASTDNRAVARYEVFRDGDLVGSTRSTEFNDSGLAAETSYIYTVTACDSADNCSDESNSVIVDTGVFVPDTTPPTVPGTPTGEAISETEISVSWAASSDEAGVVDLYELRRNGAVIATLNDTSYEDSGLSTATAYEYTVRARDNSGNWSALSGIGFIETQRPDFSYLDFTTNSHEGYVHFGEHVGPTPRIDRPDALATPIYAPGAEPAPRGFLFRIDGQTLTWEWGSNNIPQGTPGDVGFTRTAGDSSLEMHCSEDGNQTFKVAYLSNGSLTIPCSGDYTYWFRYKHPLALSSLEGTDWLHTALFTTEETVDPFNYTPFEDGSANWMRWRHPVAHDGCTAAVSDACHNNSVLRDLDRYTIWFNDAPGNTALNHTASGGILRVEAARHHAGNSNGQQQFTYNQGTGFGGEFSYGQVIQFEITALAGSQVYNDFSYYTVGLGWGSYGDPRLNMAGRAGTTMIIAGAPGADIYDEQEAIFTQPLVTVHQETLMNDFIVGHHLFHGIDPQTRLGNHDQVKIGERSCGNCHFRDGRGSEVINTPRGPRLPPPVYGVKLLEWMEGREAGFRWDGQVATVEEQIRNAFREDHGVNPDHLPPRVLETIVNYTEVLTVPNRRPAVYDDPSVARGDVVFNEIGCGGCHQPEARTRADAPTHLRNINIRPYTDMKLWDLGEGDFRTPALWGLSHNLTLLESRGREVRFMHDGASPNIEDAISRHNGTGASSKSAYNALSSSDKKAVVDFVKSL